MDKRKEFTNLLTTYLNEIDRNPTWLAAQLGKTRNTTNNWVNGEVMPSDLRVILKIAEILEMDEVDRRRLITATGYSDLLKYLPSLDANLESNEISPEATEMPTYENAESPSPPQRTYHTEVESVRGDLINGDKKIEGDSIDGDKVHIEGKGIYVKGRAYFYPSKESENDPFPSSLEILGGLRFVDFVDLGDPQTRYYLAESLVSEADWERIMKNDSAHTASSKLAKVNISISDIREFCMCANAQLADEEALKKWGYKAIRIPPHDLLEEVMKQALHIVPDRGQSSPYINKSKPTASGFYNLLGVVHQFCETSTGEHTAIGGSYQTPITEFKRGEVPHHRLIPGNGHKDPRWGFRPLLELKHPSASSIS